MFDDYSFFDDSFDPPAPSGVTVDGSGGISWPDSGSIFDTLGKIGTAVGKVATTAYQFQQARDTQNFQRQSTQLDQELALTKARGAIDVEKLRTQGQTALQRAQLAAATGLNNFGSTLGLTGSGNGYNVLMLGIAAAGLFLAWKAVK